MMRVAGAIVPLYAQLNLDLLIAGILLLSNWGESVAGNRIHHETNAAN